MSETKFVRFEPGERVDFADQQFLAKTSQLEASLSVLSGLMAQSSGSFAVIEGFTPTIFGTTLTVTRGPTGRAVAGARIDGQVLQACLIVSGPEQYAIDVGNFSAVPHGVYIRFELTEGGFANRLFWDALAGEETSQLIPTRLVGDWSIEVQPLTSPPGPEWLQIATFTPPSGAITDNRDFFFEGRVATGFVLDDTDWGSTADRLDANRESSAAQIRDLRRHVLMVNRQLQDIIGSQPENPGLGFWKEVEAGRALGDMLRVDCARDLAGNLLPDQSNQRDLGQVGQRFRSIHTTDIYTDDIDTTRITGSTGTFNSIDVSTINLLSDIYYQTPIPDQLIATPPHDLRLSGIFNVDFRLTYTSGTAVIELLNSNTANAYLPLRVPAANRGVVITDVTIRYDLAVGVASAELFRVNYLGTATSLGMVPLASGTRQWHTFTPALTLTAPDSLVLHFTLTPSGALTVWPTLVAYTAAGIGA